jgi:crossover junction endodeoxyribonuclease RusA
MLNLFLPYPPSVNTYWNFNGSRRFLTAKANKFKADVFSAFVLSEHKGFQSQRVSLTVHLYPPDKRVRDIDNVLKPLLDAFTQAGVFDDDSQVDRLLVVRKQQQKGGGCRVIIDTPVENCV